MELLDRLGRHGVVDAAKVEIRLELAGRDLIGHLADRAVLEVPARWRALAAMLCPTSTLRAPVTAAADELEILLEERGRVGLPMVLIP